MKNLVFQNDWEGEPASKKQIKILGHINQKLFTDNDASRDCVEDGEDPDPHDQLLQLVRLPAVLLHHRPDFNQ